MRYCLYYTLLVFIFIISCQRQKTVDTQKSGLNNNTVIGKIATEIPQDIKVVFQDSHQHYWFGGNKKGVYKYDGKTLILYTIDDGLCSTGIIEIQEDKQGNIYFDTHDGICKFNGQSFTILKVLDHKVAQNTWQLTSDDLWFRMGWNGNGPYRYDGKYLYQLEFPKTKRANDFYANYPNVPYSPYGIYSIYRDSKGHVWFGTASLGVCRYDGKSIQWLYEKQLTTTPHGGDFGIRSIIEDQKGDFWFCNTKYRFKLLPDSMPTTSINYQKEKGIEAMTHKKAVDYPYFLSMTMDNHGDIWMVTYDNGVWRNDGTKLIHYPVTNSSGDVLLYSIYKDRQGNLWLISHNSGIYKFNGTTFTLFTLTVN